MDIDKDIERFEQMLSERSEAFHKNIKNGIIDDWDTDSDEEMIDDIDNISITEEDLSKISMDELSPSGLPSFDDIMGA